MKEKSSFTESSPARLRARTTEKSRRARARLPAPRTEAAPSPQAMQGEPQRLMNALLADEFVIYVQTLNFHWNVRGMQFHSLHAFFETLYRQQAEIIDEIAEKVRALGGTAVATMKEYLETARIRERGGEPPDPRTMVATLASDHRAVIALLHHAFRKIENEYDDPSTSNLLADLLERHEKTTWMLQSHLDRDLFA
jgi:starvation-inducible DNA-binding protein